MLPDAVPSEVLLFLFSSFFFSGTSILLLLLYQFRHSKLVAETLPVSFLNV